MSPQLHPPEPQNWQQWHQQTWPAIQGPFVMEQSYPVAPMMTMPAPQYTPVQTGFIYGSYGHEATNSAVAPPNQYLVERPLLAMGPLRVHGMSEPREESRQLSIKTPSRSPVIKSEPEPPVTVKKDKKTRGNTAETAVRTNKQEPVFTTGIDQLLKVIQSKSNETETDQPDTQVKTCEGDDSHTAASSRRKRRADLNTKPYVCEWENCGRRFPQITHLAIHSRKHTGEKPHTCSFPKCGQTFTQKGNRSSHERRHLGLRPFHCRYQGCNKAFPQKGNLKAHEKTHDTQREPFLCILKSCGKSFSSRGNLKTHQNAYHKEELRDLEHKFSTIKSIDEMSKADRELWDYFRTIHKNSNKGIKGRGKECRVELLTPPGTLPNQCSPQSSSEVQQHHAAYAMSHGLSHSHSMGFADFNSMPPRNHLGQDFLIARGTHGQDVYEMDQASICSGTMTPASSPGGMYDEYHRSIPYHERMY